MPQLEPKGLRMLGVSLREAPVDAAAYAAANGATFLVLSDPDERDTGPAYPIFNFPTHIFIDRDGVIRSIVLEDMDTEQAVAEASRLLDTSRTQENAEPSPLSGLVHAGDHDADAVGRGADAAALVATDLPRRADGRAARHTHLTGRFTEDLDAAAAEWSADTAAFVAAILSHTTVVWAARLTRGSRRTVLVRADLTETDTLTAALVAAVLSRSAHDLVARLAHTEILGAWKVIGMQMPPHWGQQVVPSMQRIAAHGL